MQDNNVIRQCWIVCMPHRNAFGIGSTEVFLPFIYLRVPDVNKSYRVYAVDNVFQARIHLEQHGVKNIRIFRENNLSLHQVTR